MAPSASTLLNRFTVKAKFRHMQVLIKLTELGSMRRAAQAVHMTQPAISQLVAELEALMETELFFRHARGVEPTEATKELLPVAQRILAALEDGAETVANRLQEQGGIVRVSASAAAIGGLLHEALPRFAARFPDVQVHVTQASEVDPLAAIAEGAADIICTRQPKTIPEGWTFVASLEDALVVVAASHHPFATQNPVPDAALGQGLWLQNRVGSVARDRFEQAAQKGNWPAEARCPIITHIPEMTRKMLSTGAYLAILPRSVALPWIAFGDIVELVTDVTAPLLPLGYIWRPDQSGPAATKLAAQLARQ